MMRIFTIALLTIFCSTIWAQEFEQIITKEITEIDTFFNKYIVEDKYRWLENVNSEETKEWVQIQNKLAKKYLTKCLNKTNSFRTLDRYAYAKYKIPRKQGNFYFRYLHYNDLGSPALFCQSSLDDDPEKLVDPNYISYKDKITLEGYAVSKDSKFLAYQFSRNGSDWAEAKVVTIPDGVHEKDHLKGLKFSNLAWLKDGFFYSTYVQNDQFGKTYGQKVFYHQIGTEQEKDKLIFKRKNPAIYFSFQTTADERFFILKEINEEAGKYNVYYIDYTSPQQNIKPLIMNLKQNIRILDHYNGKFIATTSHDSNNGSVVEIDPENPYNWRAIVPEFSEALLLRVIPFSDRFVAVYQANQHPIITVFDYTGTILHNLELPVATSVRGFSGNYSDKELLFHFQSYTFPPIVYKFNIKTFKKELTQPTQVTYDYKDIVYEEVKYLSEDSVVVPMILVHKKDIKLDGTNPTILKAYGGFGAIVSPYFDPGIVHFVKEGGVFAFANIRGGGDLGAEWAKTGKGNNKQNSFDDFIAAAEFLIEKNYTNKDKLAITGASNGGLVVAAAAIQRPDLFKAAVPVVAPLDMLRFEKFTVGHWHADEYGTVTDSTSFTKLYEYSPYHNIKEEVNYPAMLVVTSENDDRVPPFHSYKFVAQIQNRDAQKNPILLKVEKKSGHYGASTWQSTIKEKADIYGFIMNEIMLK